MIIALLASPMVPPSLNKQDSFFDDGPSEFIS